MNKRTGKLLSLLLTLAMVLGMLPAMSLTAFAAEPGISITGTTDSSGTGWSYVNSTKTLTLNGYNGGYIQGSGLNTLNLVLEGTSTITVDDANAKGIALDNNQNLNISGSGSLTINATGGSNLIYGIECNKFTMTSGTVTINANSSKMVYGVNANSSLSVTGGKLTANITGTSDGRGLYCKTGKLTVDSGAEVDVTVTNNGSNNMYGIYNEAYTAGVTDNGDIELAGTVTITRDSGSTGSGIVYGIANGGSGGNTDGVISITGGSVTVTNAYYGIAAFTKGHDAAFADVDISGGTVNVTSTTSDSLGIVSWNNGVTISGGTVTAGTANKALWLVDSDSANKTGLVKITGGAKVSLTSTDYKALIVQGDESTSSTRVHQINLTSGGSVTVKSTSSDESYYAFPVQGYFSLGSSTKITEGSLRSTEDGINKGGGKLFVADNTTNQVVVAYGTLYTGAGAVSVNGHSFASDKLYYKNGGADTTNDSTGYNAHYDPASGVLELKDYNSGPIIIGGSNAYDLTVKLTGTNTVTTSAPIGGVGNVCVGINITNADNVTFIGDGTLTVNTNAGSGLTQVFGIWLDRSAAAAENLTFQSGKVTVNVTATDTAAQVFGVSTAKSTMGGPITVAEGAELNVTLSSASTGLANGLLSKGNITLNGKTAITLTYTGSGSPNASNWSSVSGFLGGNKLNVGANAAITVDMPDTYSLTNGMGSAYYAAKSDSQIGDEDWTNVAASEQYFENDSFLVTRSVTSGYGYADYKYEVITPLTFEDKADYDIPAGTKGTGYTATVALTATGGSGEYRYEFEGTKPSDLSINTENKLVYTRSSLCDATTATVKVTDKGGISKSITISIGAVTAPSGTGTVPHIENKTVSVGTAVTVPWPEGATAYQRFEGSTQVGSGDKSGYPDGMYIPAQSTAVTKTYKFKVSFPGGWVESNEFTVTWTATPIPAATVDAVTVSGTTGTAIAATEVNITLTNDTFASSLSGDWITNLPTGLTQSVTRTDDTHAKITVTGTPTATSTAAMTIVIPNAQLVTSGTDLTVTANANAKFNIVEPPKDLSAAVITLGTQKIYNGSAQEVVITSVTVDSTPLTKDTDYTITSGGSATNVGDTTLTITAKGSGYTGTKTASWTLQKANPTAADFDLPTLTAQDYTGSPVTVTAPTLKSGKTGAGAVTVKYAGSATAPINVGNYAVTFDVADGANFNAATGLAIGTLTINKPLFSVTITAGAHMTRKTGSDSQTGLDGAMTNTAYEADEGYYFPTDYSVATVNGISVTRNSYTRITVSGTPTANTTLTLTAATAKTKETTPAATFAANGPDSGTLSGVENGMRYSLNGGSAWTDITGASVNLTGVTTSGIQVIKPATDANTRLDSDTQTIAVTKPGDPSGVAATACTSDSNNDGTITGVTTAMEYQKSGDSGWTACSGATVTSLVPGAYHVRVKASGTALASGYVTVNVAANGATALTGTVTISGAEKFGETLTASLTGDNNTGTLSYQWKRGSTNIGANSATYTLVKEDVGNTITVVVTSSNEFGELTASTGAIVREDGPAAPSDLTGVAPTTAGGTDGKISGTTTAMEYSTTDTFTTAHDCGNGDTNGLAAGTYYVRLKQTDTHKAGSAATVTVPMYAAPNFTLDVSGTHTFPAATEGYGAQTAKSVTVSNTGTVAIGPLAVALSGANADSFTLNKTSITSIASGGTDTFTVVPKTGLTAGTYTATVTVSGSGLTDRSFDVSFTVNAGVTTYTVTFNANGGSVTPTSATTGTDGKLASLPTPTRSGSYSFAGWFTASSGGTQVTTSTVFSGNTTIYAHWTYTGGGSGGSGGSGGGGGGGSSTPAITVPVSDPKNSVQVSASVSGSTATVQKIDLSKIDPAQGVTIDFTGLGKTIESAKLPTSAIKEIGSAQGGTLTIKLTHGEVTFDAAALKAVADQAGSQLTLTLTPVKTSALNASQKEAVGDAPVFDLRLLGGSKAITDFKGGNVTVTLPHTLSKGQEPAGVVVYYLSNDGNPEACKTTYDTKNKLVTFTTTHFSLYFVGYKQPTAEWENPFTDVAEGAWYYDSIKYVYSNGMMVGTGDTKFSPDTTTTRGMIVTILYRLEGEPAVAGTSSFNDVASGRWYANAVKWAAENEIVGGYGNGNFGPEDPISREQMAAILYRYAAFKGFDMTKTADLSKFTDSGKISDWAKAALSWANAEGLINGKGGGILDPLGKATRAEIATILRNFCENVVK